jgi:hypothetical protein
VDTLVKVGAEILERRQCRYDRHTHAGDDSKDAASPIASAMAFVRVR